MGQYQLGDIIWTWPHIYNGYIYDQGDPIVVNGLVYQSVNGTDSGAYNAVNETKYFFGHATYTNGNDVLHPVGLMNSSSQDYPHFGQTNWDRVSGGTPLFTVGTASVKAYDTRNNSYPSTGGWFESAMINWSGFAGTSENPIVDYHIYYRETNDAGNIPNQNGWSTWLGVTGSAGTSGSFKIGSVNQGSSDLSWGNRNQWYQFVVIGILKDGNNTGWSCTTNWLRKSNAYVQVFNGNNATSGSTTNVYQFSGYPIVMPSCGFTKTGYTFSGWTESSNNTGTVYNAEQRVSGLSDATRNWWAKWTPISYKITYDENGGSSVSDKTYTIETDLTLSSAPTKKGYSFNGWKLSNTVGNWTAKTYSVSAHIGTGKYGNITLVAQWKVIDYSITYTLNDGTVSSANPTSYNIETATFTLKNPTKTGYTFTGWTGSNGTTPSKSVSMAKGSTGNKSYTANFTPNQYTITYKANGGIESDVKQTVTYGTSWTTNGNIFTRIGYKQVSWNTKSDGSGTTYSLNAGQTNKQLSNVTLYAIWEPVNVVFYRPPSDSWHLCNSYFRPPNSDWKQAIMFKKIKDTWYRSILK